MRSALLVSLSLILWTAGSLPAVGLNDRGRPSSLGWSADSLYVLPILDGRPTPERVEDILVQIGGGHERRRVGFSGVFRYMADVDPNREDSIVTSRLEEIVTAARASEIPFLVHLNGGRWAGGGPLVNRLMDDHRLMSWDHLGRPWTHRQDGEYHFSLGAYNDGWRWYKRRNLQAAASWLAEFARGADGHLLVGVSTDSEVLLNTSPWADYNSVVIREYVDWLTSRGIYGPGGRWYGQGWGLSLKAINDRHGTGFRRLEEIRPPREPGQDNPWRDWQQFRELLVDHNVQEQVDWIREAGIPAERIFTHQSPSLNVELFGDALGAAHVEGGRTGITAYGATTRDEGLFDRVKMMGGPWGIFEYNPRSDDVSLTLAGLQMAADRGAVVICPYHWDDLGGPNEVGFTIKGTAFQAALRQFVDQNATGSMAEDVP